MFGQYIVVLGLPECCLLWQISVRSLRGPLMFQVTCEPSQTDTDEFYRGDREVVEIS